MVWKVFVNQMGYEDSEYPESSRRTHIYRHFPGSERHQISCTGSATDMPQFTLSRSICGLQCELANTHLDKADHTTRGMFPGSRQLQAAPCSVLSFQNEVTRKLTALPRALQSFCS